MKPRHGVLIIAVLALAAAVPVSALNPGYRVSRWTAGGSAGGVSSSASYAVHGTLGQPAVGSSSGDTYTVVSGIWLGASGNVSTTVYLPLVLSAYTTFHEITGDVPDTCSAAMPVEMNHTYRDNFDDVGDDDWYSFDAVSGVTYTIDTFDLDGNSDTYMYLYADCNTKITEDDESGDETGAARIVWTATESGTLYVWVEHWDYRQFGSNTFYSFSVR